MLVEGDDGDETPSGGRLVTAEAELVLTVTSDTVSEVAEEEVSVLVLLVVELVIMKGDEGVLDMLPTV